MLRDILATVTVLSAGILLKKKLETSYLKIQSVLFLELVWIGLIVHFVNQQGR